YYKLIPKRYSPTSSINLGVGFQKNIGLERINFNTGLSYQANVNDIVTHRLTLFNTQLSLTRNKDLYYEYFTKDQIFRDQAFQNYSPMMYQQFLNGQISSDELSSMIIKDQAYVNRPSGGELNSYNSFRQSSINEDRPTQDVLISASMFNVIYHEMGKKAFQNPYATNGKIEVARNVLDLFVKDASQQPITTGEVNTIFKVPYSQFVKFDVDV